MAVDDEKLVSKADTIRMQLPRGTRWTEEPGLGVLQRQEWPPLALLFLALFLLLQ